MRRSIAVLIAMAGLLAASCNPSSSRDAESLASGRALNSWSALLEVTPGHGSVQMEILRDARPIDRFAVTGGQPITYTDYLLAWAGAIAPDDELFYRSMQAVLAAEPATYKAYFLDNDDFARFRNQPRFLQLAGGA